MFASSYIHFNTSNSDVKRKSEIKYLYVGERYLSSNTFVVCNQILPHSRCLAPAPKMDQGVLIAVGDVAGDRVEMLGSHGESRE